MFYPFLLKLLEREYNLVQYASSKLQLYPKVILEAYLMLFIIFIGYQMKYTRDKYFFQFPLKSIIENTQKSKKSACLAVRHIALPEGDEVDSFSK